MLPVKPVSPLPAKPDPPLPPCPQRIQFHPNQQSQIHCYQLACSKFRVSAVSCSQGSQFYPYQWSQIHHYQHAHSKSRFTPTSEARSTITSEASFTCTSEVRCTTASMPPANPVSPVPEKPYPLLPAYPQQSQIVREVSCSQQSQFHPYQRSLFHLTSEAGSTCTSLVPVMPVSPLPAMLLPACSQQSEIVQQMRVSMSAQWDHAWQNFKCDILRVAWARLSVVNVRFEGVSLSELCKPACQSCGSVQARVVGASLSELWEWAWQSCWRKLFRGVGASLFKLWEWAWQSCWSKLVRVVRVRMSKFHLEKWPYVTPNSLRSRFWVGDP